MRLHRISFFLLLVFLPTQLGLHFWPEWATVLGRRVDYLSPTLYLTDLLVLATLVCWFISNVGVIPAAEPGSIRRNSGKTGFRVKPGMTAGALAFLLFIFINIVFATNKPVALYAWLKLTEFGLLGFYIFKTKPSLSLIVFGLVPAVFYSSLIAFAQFFLQHSVGGLLWWLGERTFNLNTPGIAHVNLCSPFSESCQLLLRPYATFSHPNVLAGFLAVTLPLVISQLSNNQLVKPSNLKKIIYSTVLIMGVAALTLTFSRSGLMAGALGIIITARIAVQTKKLKKFLLFSCVILIFITLFQLRNISLTDESLVVREQLNAAAAKLWSQSPIFGIGFGNFLVELPQVLPSRSVYFLQPVHNIYLLILSETGIIGLILFLWLIWKSIGKAISKNERNHFITYHLSLITLLLLGLVDHYPLTLQQGQLLLSFLLSLSLAY